MSDQWVRASEIADYLYCRRSWWLKRAEGHLSDNVRELESGTRYHKEHGRLLSRSIWTKRIAYVLLFFTVAILTFQFLMNS